MEANIDQKRITQDVKQNTRQPKYEERTMINKA